MCRVIHLYCVKCLLSTYIYCVAGADEKGDNRIIGMFHDRIHVLVIYGVASISRIDKMIGLFCKRAL